MNNKEKQFQTQISIYNTCPRQDQTKFSDPKQKYDRLLFNEMIYQIIDYFYCITMCNW